MNGPLDRHEIAHRHMSMDGPDLTIELERTPEAVVRDGPGVTFSAEAVRAMADELSLWISTRLLRAMDNDHPPRRLVVAVHVELDGHPAT